MRSLEQIIRSNDALASMKAKEAAEKAEQALAEQRNEETRPAP